MFPSLRVLVLSSLLFMEGRAIAQEETDADEGGGSEEDLTVEIATERATDPRAARLDYAFGLDVGYNSNVSGIPDQFDPEDSVTAGQSARIIYRVAGDQRTGVSVRGVVSVDEVPNLRRFDSRSESFALNGYKTISDKLRLTADASFTGIRQDNQRVGDVRSLSLEASWQHNPQHRSLLTYVLTGQEIVDRGNDPDREVAEETNANGPELDDDETQAGLIEQARQDFLQRQSDRQSRLIEDELDPDGLYTTVQARHDANFTLFGKRSVFISALSYTNADGQGESIDSQSISGVAQLVYLFTGRLSLDSTFSYRLSDYENPNVLTNFDETRSDISRAYSVGLRWVQNQNLNYRLGISHQNVDSSIPDVYTFDRTAANLSVEWRGER